MGESGKRRDMKHYQQQARIILSKHGKRLTEKRPLEDMRDANVDLMTDQQVKDWVDNWRALIQGAKDQLGI